MWLPHTDPLAIVIRVATLYLGLLCMIRLAGKREVGQLTPIDLLGMLLLSETVSPALTASDPSVGGALLAAAALLAISVGVSRIAYHWPRSERWIEGSPTALVEAGSLIPEAARAERITRAELEAALRRHGLARLDQVHEACVETNGEITIVPRSPSS